MTRLQNNITSFAEVNGIDVSLYEKAKDLYNHKRSISGDKTAHYDDKVAFSEKEAILDRDMLKAVAKMANISEADMTKNPMAYMSNPMVRWATFQVVSSVIDAILPESLIETVGLYSEIKVIGYGDSASFDVKPRDLFAVSQAGRGKRNAELHKQYNGTVTVVPQNHEVTVYVSMFRVLAGLESLGEFMMKAAKSIETALTYEIYDAFAAAMAGLPTTTGAQQLNVTGYSQASFVTLAQKVTAWNMGRKAIAVGTQNALASILPTNTNFRYMLDSDYAKIGYVQTLAGIDTLVLPQVADYTTPFGLKLDDTKIYIISPTSDKLVKVALGGDTISTASDVFDNANLVQTGTMIKQWGVAVATNSIAGIITLS